MQPRGRGIANIMNLKNYNGCGAEARAQWADDDADFDVWGEDDDSAYPVEWYGEHTDLYWYHVVQGQALRAQHKARGTHPDCLYNEYDIEAMFTEQVEDAVGDTTRRLGALAKECTCPDHRRTSPSSKRK